jgi:hypothetical protein
MNIHFYYFCSITIEQYITFRQKKGKQGRRGKKEGRREGRIE